MADNGTVHELMNLSRNVLRQLAGLLAWFGSLGPPMVFLGLTGLTRS